jgi:glutathione reductase (NADPH)
MADFDFDFFVIGGGSGGVRAARFAGGFGARVALAEESKLGGTCVNAGCIPKKLFAYSAHYSDEVHDAAGFGWLTHEPDFSWDTLLANKDAEIARLNAGYERVLRAAKVEILQARARLLDAHTIEVGGRRCTAAHVLIAVGSHPMMPPIPGIEHAISSDQAFHLARLPHSIAIVGGGYIAVEFASIFNGLGVETSLLYRGERLLKSFDVDLGAFLAEQMSAKGVRLAFRQQIEAIRRSDAGLRCDLDDGSALEVEGVMFATGRTPNTAGMGLEAAGVRLGADGAVLVDERFQTNVPSIHAIGDCTGRVQLTPVALAEGMAVAERLFANKPRSIDYDIVPTAVFSNPSVGSVGLSESEAKRRGHDVEIYRTTFTPLKHRLSASTERILMKLVVDKRSDRVLGVHMVGADAGEIIQGFAVALTCKATKRQFDETIGIHPTAAEEFVTLREPAVVT